MAPIQVYWKIMHPALMNYLLKEPPRSIGEAIIKIKELTGIEGSHSRVRTFMKGHKFRFLKTGHIPAKVNNTEQQDWVEKTLSVS